MSRTAFVAATLALSLALGGCSNFLSATRDKPVDDDRGTRTIGSEINDSLVETKAAMNIAKVDPALDKDSHIVVVSYNGVVLIAGQTPHVDLRSKIEQAVRAVQKVKSVHNELQMTSLSSLLARNNDAWITAKLKTQMLSSPNMSLSRIKVVTEDGIVHMMGLASQQETTQAVRVAQGVDGMQKIVKLFKCVN